RVFTCQPSKPVDEAACARTILSSLGRRAYRRPVTSADLDPILQQYAGGRAQGTVDNGIEQGLRLILANPKFIFRTETSPDAAGPIDRNAAGPNDKTRPAVARV